MREIKFRAWDGKKMHHDVTIFDGRFINAEDAGETLWYWHDPADQVAIMQYTGLKDKNGVEIYEGDIMMSPNGKRDWIVKWIDCRFCLQSSSASWEASIKIDWEVIGNIYQTPELLS